MPVLERILKRFQEIRDLARKGGGIASPLFLEAEDLRGHLSHVRNKLPWILPMDRWDLYYPAPEGISVEIYRNLVGILAQYFASDTYYYKQYVADTMWYKGLRDLTTTGKTDDDRVKAAPFYFREASRRLERFVGDYPLFVLLLEISNACNTMDANIYKEVVQTVERFGVPNLTCVVYGNIGALGEKPPNTISVPQKPDLSLKVPSDLRARDPELVSELMHWLNRNNMLR